MMIPQKTIAYTEQMYLSKIKEKLPKTYHKILKRKKYRCSHITETQIKNVANGITKDHQILQDLIEMGNGS